MLVEVFNAVLLLSYFIVLFIWRINSLLVRSFGTHRQQRLLLCCICREKLSPFRLILRKPLCRNCGISKGWWQNGVHQDGTQSYQLRSSSLWMFEPRLQKAVLRHSSISLLAVCSTWSPHVPGVCLNVQAGKFPRTKKPGRELVNYHIFLNNFKQTLLECDMLAFRW